jgi:CRP-like cAMP-binding protein
MKRSCFSSISCNNCSNKHGIIPDLSQIEKEEFSNVKTSFSFKKGEIIFQEGNYAHNLYCISIGKIKLSKLGKDGKEQIVRFAKDGDILGYRSLLSSESYHATAFAMEETHVCIIPRDTFKKTIEENYRLSLRMMQLLSSDLKHAEQHLIDIAQKTVRERICEALVLLINSFGYTPNSKIINVTITRSEIADFAGTTTESAIRAISSLSAENIIAVEGKSIKIVNYNELVKNANTLD